MATELGTDRTQVYRWLGINGRKPTEPGGVWVLQLLRVLGVRLDPAPPEELAPATLREELRDLREAMALALDETTRNAAGLERLAESVDALLVERGLPPSARLEHGNGP
jgi:hypothetical protein